jgi:hypothetical protein
MAAARDAPPLHPNCECSLDLFVAEDEEPEEEEKAYNPDQPRDDHGRWTSGGASVVDEHVDTGPAREYKGPSAFHVADWAGKVKDDLGYRGSFMVDSNEPEKFKVGEQTYAKAGQFDPRNKLITLYTQGMKWSTADDIRGIMAHEVEHAKFDRAKEAHDAEWKEIMKIPADPRHDAVRPDGLLNAPYDKQFPNYQEFERAYFLPFTESWRLTDGVSNYSVDWWKAQLGGTARSEQAINETLAEMAKAKYTTGSLPEHWGPRMLMFQGRNAATGEYIKPTAEEIGRGTKQWRELYHAIDNINRRLDWAEIKE